MRRLMPRLTSSSPLLLSVCLLAAATLSCTAVPGSSQLTATAQSGSGGSSNAPDSAGVVVVFIAPDNNSTIAEGASITLAVNATNPNGGIGKVDFMVDDHPLGSQSAPTSGQTSFTARQTWIAAGVQGHFVQAVASGPDGKSIGDAKIAVTVVTPPPKVALSASNNPAGTQVATVALPTLTPSGAAPQPAAPQAGATAPRPTSKVVMVVKVPTLNVHNGDKAGFPVIGALKANDTVAVIGRNSTSSWWYILKDPMQGWVINDPTLNTVQGDTSTLPVVKSPPTPIPSNTPSNVQAPTSTP